VGATWAHRPHNFLAVGAIAPMESAPMLGRLLLPLPVPGYAYARSEMYMYVGVAVTE